MGIIFDESKGLFHLFSENTSYIVCLKNEVNLVHLYWGQRLRNPDVRHLLRPVYRAFSPSTHEEETDLSLDTLPLEFASFGTGDFRSPGIVLQNADGSNCNEFKYVKHSIVNTKPQLEGLPAVYAEKEDEVQTLEIHLYDEISEILVKLSYSVFEVFNAICRSVQIVNQSKETIFIDKIMSSTIDFHRSSYDLIQLSGSWAKERHLFRSKLRPGMQSIESRRGASSHMQNPFVALASRESTEHGGDVYGFSLVYSGNFLAEIEVDQFETSRVNIGINPFNFSWKLQPEESFQSPETVMVYSDKGLNGMSGCYHELYRERLCRGVHKKELRPILVNNWEATYFDFNEEKLLEVAKEAKDLGIELFVLDDGWFGKRNADDSSLGDWVEDSAKLPNGLSGLEVKISKLGLDLGLWVEPEMISIDSDLFRSNPDWCFQIPERRLTESRTQLVLNLSRPEICDWLLESMSKVFESANIKYVKWDMNRNMTEVFSQSLPVDQQGEVSHRYILGLYGVLETLTKRFPKILFESCAGGGGRFDPGMLYYMPQTWTSDNTDAVERIKIQYGTSLVYPPVTMGSHVSTIPNHQVHRNTSLLTRLQVSMSGNFGFELDLTQLQENEKELIKQQNEVYKQIRPLVQFGDFYRLSSPFQGNLTAWMFVSKDKCQIAVFYCKLLSEAHEPERHIHLVGLDENRDYRLVNYDPFFEALNYKEIYEGDALMKAGFRVTPMIGDFQSGLIRFESVQ